MSQYPDQPRPEEPMPPPQYNQPGGQSYGGFAPPPYPAPPGFQPYPPAYGMPQYYAGPMAPSTNGMAIASLVCSIANFFMVPLVGGLLAVIFGHVARGQIRNANGTQTGATLALIGLIVGYIGLALDVAVIVLIIVLIIANPSNGNPSPSGTPA